MPARTFDWRDDPMGTVLAVPAVRARFMRFEPGFAQDEGHSHEQSGGWETFLVLEGTLEFDIDGTAATVGPGQALTYRAVAVPLMTVRHRKLHTIRRSRAARP